MRRANKIALILLAIIVFLVISALLTRALSVGGAEDSAVADLVKAEAKGNTAAVISLISGCSSDPACRARAAEVSTTLKAPGSVSIAEMNASSNFSLTSTLGTARVAWLVGSSLPRVQCVRVRHAGNVVSGFRVQLLEVSARIKSDQDCPAHF
jgi:hypothetical protein